MKVTDFMRSNYPDEPDEYTLTCEHCGATDIMPMWPSLERDVKYAVARAVCPKCGKKAKTPLALWWMQEALQKMVSAKYTMPKSKRDEAERILREMCNLMDDLEKARETA